MKLWDHLWAGVLVALAIGVFLIGGGAYSWALSEQNRRQRERLVNELVTGVKLPPPDAAQVTREWDQDMAAGAIVGGTVWLVGAVLVFGGAWRKRHEGALERQPHDPSHPE